ncbi:MAG: propanediol utilization protein [Albidovulum sp.]
MTPAPIRVAGHFGELMQGRIGPGGPVVLISLPCPSLSVSALHMPGAGFAIHGAGQRLITPERARRFLNDLGVDLHGRVALRADMPAGGGAGASTASLVALARLAGAKTSPDDLARACIRAEGASDPLMFAAPEQMLWASRLGRNMAPLPPLPRFDVIGGFFGPHRRTEARDATFPDIADLIKPWVKAATIGDAAALAALASTSARRTLKLRGPSGDPTEALAEKLGAAGFAIAHTGSARALLFPAQRIADTAIPMLRAAGFRQVVRFSIGGKGKT